jgi:hypothetical protein
MSGVCRIALSDKGWTNNFIAARWFEKCFLPQAMARNSSGKTILLIYDGHKSHETIELRETAVQHKIELYRLPAHTSHRLQPLDVGVFGPLQRAWQNRCAAAMEDSGQEITRQQVVKEYMAARTESFKEKTILSAWRNSGISPFDPDRFSSHDFGPSIPSSFKAPLPKSFPMPPTDPESPDDDDISVVDEGFNDDDIEWENEESNEGEEGNADGDCADHLNLDIWNELPVLAESPAINQHSLSPPPHSSSTPLPLDALAQPCLPHEEGGEPRGGPQGDPPSCMELPPPSSTAHSYTFRSQTRSQSKSTSHLSQAAPAKSVDERLAATEKRIKELEREVEKLGTYCILSGGVITRLQKRVNTKENKKKTAARAKKTTGEARVLTSEEGRQELQQLREESRQKELRQNEELARKAAEDLARRKRRADLTHTFTGGLNKSRRKEELADIAAALSLLDSGKKDDIFERIMKEFDENPGLKTNPRFEGLFQSRPRKRARVDDGAPTAGPSTATNMPLSKSWLPPDHPCIDNGPPGPSNFYQFPPHSSLGTTEFDGLGPAHYQPNTPP